MMTDKAQEANKQDMPSAQPEEPNSKFQQANAMLKKYLQGSGAVGLLPFPLLDMVLLSGLQLKMLQSLAKIYEIPFSKEIGKSTLGSLVGGALPAQVGMGIMGIASAMKWIPAVGTAVGVASTSALAVATTYAVGKVFIQHFESGGTFLNFDPEKVRQYFAQEFEKAHKNHHSDQHHQHHQPHHMPHPEQEAVAA
ncbi:MAG: DUF697 domain-containing protein [Magnetococcus sp. YQC-5]